MFMNSVSVKSDRFQDLLQASHKKFNDFEILEFVLYLGGIENHSNHEIATNLIDKFGSFPKVVHASHNDLSAVKGINEKTIAAIKLASLSAMRLLKSEVDDRPIIQNSKSLIKYCKAMLSHLKLEQFHVFCLNKDGMLIKDIMLAEGTIDHVPVYIREFTKSVLDAGAAKIFLAHNHPSGNLKPSKNDIRVTRDICMAMAMLEIDVIDHIIIANNKHFSFYEHGLM